MADNKIILDEVIEVGKKVASLDTKICVIKETVEGIDERQRIHDSLIPKHCAVIKDLKGWHDEHFKKLQNNKDRENKCEIKKAHILWDTYNRFKGVIWIVLLIVSFFVGNYFNILNYFK